MPTLLLFNVEPSRRAKIQVIALQSGCRLLTVPPERYGATLTQLINGGGEAAALEEAPFTEELLVMDGLGERQLDLVLAGLRRQRIRVALKAVVTPTNAAWTAQKLYAELCRERAAFDAGRQAHT